MPHHCRISRVRMKAGGAEVRVLTHEAQGMAKRVKTEANRLLWAGGADAWAIVGFWRDRDGGDRWHVEYEVYREAGIFKRMWPDAVRSLLEKRMNDESDNS